MKTVFWLFIVFVLSVCLVLNILTYRKLTKKEEEEK